ncbi:hypothetical protein [Chitinophaga arvensicola]|uniref:Uncharacterized protein n=1 Tax=Chitinophaga arvensicola TaxID=29529 RepID=A0A1I0S922_9BACT|nr:hypothetical protein [Chitinophaga arvensicola]SEW52642.1 hypothetical protein SAMN04488122_4996 [Chitinophaga arvensicola]
MVEVFVTNVQRVAAAKEIVALLLRNFPESKINFDLEDRDRVLRVEGNDFHPGKIMMLVTENGFECQVMEE